jgi:hypothetical protein
MYKFIFSMLQSSLWMKSKKIDEIWKEHDQMKRMRPTGTFLSAATWDSCLSVCSQSVVSLVVCSQSVMDENWNFSACAAQLAETW